jgi:hypothetical protein
MRHLVGVILAVVMAVVLFFAASWGYLKLGAGRTVPAALPSGGGAPPWHDRALVEGFVALAATGLVAGILIAVPRISPLAAGLPGLVLLAWTGLYLSGARRALQDIPLRRQPSGAGFEDLLAGGVLAVAGLVMVIPLFVPSRWRRRSGPARVTAPDADTSTFPDTQATQTMAGGSVFSPDWSTTSTRPQPRIDPPSQAPWGPAEYR